MRLSVDSLILCAGFIAKASSTRLHSVQIAAAIVALVKKEQ
jgi:hypothetical protein